MGDERSGFDPQMHVSTIEKRRKKKNKDYENPKRFFSLQDQSSDVFYSDHLDPNVNMNKLNGHHNLYYLTSQKKANCNPTEYNKELSTGKNNLKAELRKGKEIKYTGNNELGRKKERKREKRNKVRKKEKGIRKDSTECVHNCEEHLIHSAEIDKAAEGFMSQEQKDKKFLDENEDLEAARKQRRRVAALSRRRKLRERRRAKLGQVTDFST